MCGQQYGIQFRHLVLQPSEERVMNAHDHIYLLIEPICDMRVESSTGVFEWTEDLTNELQYEHKGDITIRNNSIFLNHVRFVQVIPKNCEQPCR